MSLNSLGSPLSADVWDHQYFGSCLDCSVFYLAALSLAHFSGLPRWWFSDSWHTEWFFLNFFWFPILYNRSHIKFTLNSFSQFWPSEIDGFFGIILVIKYIFFHLGMWVANMHPCQTPVMLQGIWDPLENKGKDVTSHLYICLWDLLLKH